MSQLYVDLELVSVGVVSVVAGARGGQLEGLDGEGEVMIVRVIHQEPGHGDTVIFRAAMRTSRKYTVPGEDTLLGLEGI